MAQGIENQSIADIQGNASLLAQFPQPVRNTAWFLRRPRTKQPTVPKLNNRSQKKGYFC